LESTIQNTDGAKNKLTAASKTQEFWKMPMISEEELLAHVDNGDLILFRTKKYDKKVMLVKELYDHIAIFVRKGNYELFLFEAPAAVVASEQPGSVTLSSWNNFIKKNYSLLYQKIIYRRLIGNRDADFNNKLALFIKRHLGVVSSKGPRKLSRDEDSRTEVYSAELIAACYKAIGVLEPSTNASQLEPGKLE